MEPREFDLKRVLGLLRRQFGLILAVFILVMGATTIVAFTLEPSFTASALVLVDPSRKDLLDPNAPVGNTAADSARVDSEVELVESERTLLAAVEEAELLDDPEFAPQIGLRDTVLSFLRLSNRSLPTGEEALAAVLSKLRGAVSVQRRGLTYLISIQARAANPAVAARIANAVARAYISGQLEAKIASTLTARDTIQARIEDSGQTMVASEAALNRFIAETIDELEPASGGVDLAQLRAQIDTFENERLRVLSAISLANTDILQDDWESAAANLQSEAVARLGEQRAEIARNLEAAAVGSSAEVELRAELEKVEEFLDVASQAAINSMRDNVAAADEQANALRVSLRESVLRTDLPPEVLGNLYDVQQRAVLARTQYETLLTRLNELEAQAYLQIADSRLVMEATPPSSPSSPNLRLIFALSTVGALVLGIGMAVLRENFIGGVTSADHAEAVLKVPMVLGVPRQKPPRNGDIADLVAVAPLSAYSESIRRIRARVDQALRRLHQSDGTAADGSGSVIMVTSTEPGEGKTTIGLSLARTYALTGRRTLLVDCDLRKPSVHKQLGIEPQRGLLDFLEDGGTNVIAELVTTDTQSGADIIAGSHRSEKATDHLFTGRGFPNLMAEVRRRYEIIVLDTPPVGPVVDGLYLAQFANVALFVLRYASTSQQDARSALTLIREAQGEKGEQLAVFSQEEGSRSAYRNRYSDYYEEV